MTYKSINAIRPPARAGKTNRYMWRFLANLTCMQQALNGCITFMRWLPVAFIKNSYLHYITRAVYPVDGISYRNALTRSQLAQAGEQDLPSGTVWGFSLSNWNEA